MTDDQKDSITIPDRRAPNPYRKPFLVLVAVISLSLLAQAFSSWQTWSVAHDTNTIVKDVNFRNSPANIKRQEEVLNQIVIKLDCNSRRAIEDAINDLGMSKSIDITGSLCDSSVTTTTRG